MPIDHVALYVGDPDRAKAFYGNNVEAVCHKPE
jgi:catechol 2,3-dioxygenase-like lactoylglutathione lyase family enzyme